MIDYNALLDAHLARMKSDPGYAAIWQRVSAQREMQLISAMLAWAEQADGLRAMVGACAETKLIKLGAGNYVVASGHGVCDGVPCITIRRSATPLTPGEIQTPGESHGLSDYEVVIEVHTAKAAEVLLVVAQAVAFAHGVEEAP